MITQPDYWKHLICCLCQKDWYICILHPNRQWYGRNKSSAALKHFIDIPHPPKKTQKCSIPEFIAPHIDPSPLSSISNPTIARSRPTSQDDVYSSVSYNTSSKDVYGGMEEVWEHEKTPSTTDSALTKNFMSSVSLKYFEKELRGPLTGICSLVANAFLYCKDNSTLETVDEALFHMTLLGLLGSMTSSQKNTLMDIFGIIKDNTNLFEITRLPTTMCDARRIYMSGKNSILNNIPHPEVFVRDNHACVSLKDVIAHQICHGMDLDNMVVSTKYRDIPTNTNKGILSSKAAMNMRQGIMDQYRGQLKDDIMLFYVIFWSNDFEVTHIKKHHSVWIHTVTICPPDHSITSPRYTHALSLSTKGHNHDNILGMYHDELNELNTCNYMWYGKKVAQFL